MAVIPPAAAGVRRGPLVVRALVPCGGVLVLLAGGHLVPVPALLLVIGVGLAVAQPETVGAWAAVPAAVLSFAAATATDVGAGRVALAAAGIYLLHTATAAAAACPLGARIDPAVTRRWLRRCLPAVLLTAVVLAIDAALGDTPDNPLFVTAAALLAAGAVVSLVRLLAATREGGDDPAV